MPFANRCKSLPSRSTHDITSVEEERLYTWLHTTVCSYANLSPPNCLETGWAIIPIRCYRVHTHCADFCTSIGHRELLVGVVNCVHVHLKQPTEPLKFFNRCQSNKRGGRKKSKKGIVINSAPVGRKMEWCKVLEISLRALGRINTLGTLQPSKGPDAMWFLGTSIPWLGKVTFS